MEKAAVLCPLSEHILHVAEASLESLNSVRRPEPNANEYHDSETWEHKDHEFGLDEQNVNPQAVGHFLGFGLQRYQDRHEVGL